MAYKSLTEYNFPQDLKTMSLEEMDRLCGDIREFLVEKVSKTGGHLASNLGVVELTVAIHKYYKTPKDKIVWDVGHQTYVHKILTGRAKDFDTLRLDGGMSGFPKQAESEHDLLDMGHSSTSVSIAAGLAAARDLRGEDYAVVAVIGDGALTGGEAYEALNSLGATKGKVITILNDNGMSISKNTGGMSQHLSGMRTSKAYQEFKLTVKNTLKKTPGVYKGVEHIKDTVKYAFMGGVVFEEMGITYLGPVDGHNIEDLLNAFSLAKRVQGPVIIHAITKKGKGYAPAEANPGLFHGIGPFDIATGKPLSKGQGISYSKVFGDKLVELAGKDPGIVAVSAAMIEGTGLTRFAELYPDRIFDMGIAEQSAVSFAAGLAKNGLQPVVAIYSTFLQRGYDQIMIDVCLNKLPVIFAIDRAGCVGQDGQTHHGVFDLSYLSHMPGMTVLSPRDGIELEEMMEYALTLDGPVAIRYPRGNATNFETSGRFCGHNYFMVNHDSEKTDVEIWASGKMVKSALSACDILTEKGYKVSVLNNAVIFPLDTELLNTAESRTKMIVTLEDNVVTGGAGQSISAYLSEIGSATASHVIGWPTEFIEHGTTDMLFEKYGLDGKGVAERISGYIEGQA
jgi:1-deoxy-D-xylulose-5-phosphate synthase